MGFLAELFEVRGDGFGVVVGVEGLAACLFDGVFPACAAVAVFGNFCGVFGEGVVQGVGGVFFGCCEGEGV